jgi:hypothetical protein
MGLADEQLRYGFYFRWTLTQGNADSQFVWTGAGTNWLPVSGDFTLD